MVDWTILERMQTQQAREVDPREWLWRVADGLLDVHRRLKLVEVETGLDKPK